MGYTGRGTNVVDPRALAVAAEGDFPRVLLALAEIWKMTAEASWSIGSLVVIFCGIYGGVFTPTKAAGVTVIYSLFVTMVVHREVDLAGLPGKLLA